MTKEEEKQAILKLMKALNIGFKEEKLNEETKRDTDYHYREHRSGPDLVYRAHNR